MEGNNSLSQTQHNKTHVVLISILTMLRPIPVASLPPHPTTTNRQVATNENEKEISQIITTILNDICYQVDTFQQCRHGMTLMLSSMSIVSDATNDANTQNALKASIQQASDATPGIQKRQSPTGLFPYAMLPMRQTITRYKLICAANNSVFLVDRLVDSHCSPFK